MGANTATFTDDNFQAEVLNSSQPVLVDFFAPWCQPCRMLSPVIDQLASEYSGSVKVGKLNTDDAPNTAVRYNIDSIPAVLVFKNGNVVAQFRGVQPKAKLQAAIDEAVG